MMPMPGTKLLRRMFGLDWRSLALLRMGLAVVLLADLAVSAQDLKALFTDAGVLPREWLREGYTADLSIHLLGDGVWFQGALFALEGAFAVMMLVGYRTRLATAACWFLLLSRQARQPLALYGADMVEHLAFFWALWLPLNRRFSVDAALGRVPPPDEKEYFGMAGFCVIAQFMAIYLTSALQKTGPTWTTDHTAVYYALALKIYSTPFGQWLNQFDALTRGLTVFVLGVELYAPFLMILPFATGYGRMAGFLLFLGLQVGFGLCLELGLFGAIMVAFMFMLLPAEFWEWCANPPGRWLRSRLKFLQRFHAAAPSAGSRPPAPGLESVWRRGGMWALRRTRDGALLAALGLVVLLNIASFPNQSKLVSDKAYRLAYDIGLSQKFDLFAPDPQTYDGWFVLRGWLKNGRNVDLLTGASPANFDPPERIAESYIDERWNGYLMDLTSEDFLNYRKGLADYLAQEWNATHAGSAQVQKVEIIFMCFYNGPDHTVSDTNPIYLWTQNY